MSLNDEKKGTGRTTRMLKEAIDLAGQGRTVFVIATDERHAETMMRMAFDMLDNDWAANFTPLTMRYMPLPNSFIQFGTPERLGFHWDLMRAKVYGPNAIFLVDHHTIESRWPRLLEMWRRWDATGPEVVTLCGSSRFKEQHLIAMKEETLAGRIVLPMGLYGHVDGLDMEGPVKAMLDDLHFRKIDRSDAILVVSVDRYIGSSTRREIDYATAKGKKVRYWEDEKSSQSSESTSSATTSATAPFPSTTVEGA